MNSSVLEHILVKVNNQSQKDYVSLRHLCLLKESAVLHGNIVTAQRTSSLNADMVDKLIFLGNNGV